MEEHADTYPVYENQQPKQDDMLYEGPDDFLQNPLFITEDSKAEDNRKMTIAIAVLQGVIMLIVAIILLLGIVILVKPYVIETTCSSSLLLGKDGGPSANCSIAMRKIADMLATQLPSQVDADQLISVLTNWISNSNIPPTCSLPDNDETAQKLAKVINMTTNNNEVRNQLWTGLSQLLDLTNGITQDITYISGLSDNNAAKDQNITDKLNFIIQAYQNASLVLSTIVGSLANVQTTTTSTAGVTNDILLMTEDILDLTNRTYYFNYINIVSCKDILRLHPNSSSGYYHINSRTVYCNMDNLCGGEGGWTRLAHLDMSDTSQSCPSGFRTYTSGSVRACGRFSGGCNSLIFNTNGISYTEICGRVTGYQYFSPAISDTGSIVDNIDAAYTDGVMITRGSPRQHVWTLFNGLFDTYNGYHAAYNCPCNNPPPPITVNIPSFIGSNYFCESGNHDSNWRPILYTDDPLWDGQGCGPLEGPCCAAPGLPWFHRNYGNMTSTDYIELRVCGNQSPHDEDSPVSYYDIYIK